MLNVKKERKKKYEQRWSILKDNFLIFFKSQNVIYPFSIEPDLLQDKKHSGYAEVEKVNVKDTLANGSSLR